MAHSHIVFQCRYCDGIISRCCPEDLSSYQVRRETCEICEKRLKMILQQIPNEAAEEPKPKASCCEARKKIIVKIAQILPEEVCGVGDSSLADFLNHDTNSPGGLPILMFQFCPWCGRARDPNGQTRVTEEA